VINREPVSGAVYGDMLPNGTKVYSIIGQPKIVLNGRTLDAPFEMMFNRLSTDGRVAAKAHEIGHAWIYDGAWHDTGFDSAGVQGHGWNPDGSLAIISGARDQESQGLRFYDSSLPPSLANLDVTRGTPGWVTGSPSYGPQSPLAQSLGISLYAWTKHGDVVVGQGASGGAVIQYHGQQYLLEPGDTQFIQFHREGSKLAIAITKLLEQSVVFVTLEESDITTLQVYQVLPGEPAPIPVPPPTPEPPSMSSPVTVPNLSELSRMQWDAHQMRERQLWAHAEGGKPAILRLQAHYFARLTPQVQAALPIGWKVLWERYRNPVPGTTWNFLPDQFLLVDPNGWVHAVKVIVGASEAEHEAADVWELDEHGERRYRWVLGAPAWNHLSVNGREGSRLDNVTVDDPLMAPLPESALGPSPFKSVQPKPEDPKPEPPKPPATTPVEEPDYAALFDMVLDRITEIVRTEVAGVAAGLHSDIADIRKELDTLAFEARHRLLGTLIGTLTLTRKK
jgi:hypothetical protein